MQPIRLPVPNAYSEGRAYEVKKPPVGVRFDRPEKRLSTPGIPAYTSQDRGRASSFGSPMTEWSSPCSLGGASPRMV